MFTGIVECIGKIVEIKNELANITFTIEANIAPDLKIDQSVAHNGVCLTVTKIKNNTYKVTAIYETLQKTNLGLLQVGDEVNLERCMVFNGRIDGHIVQGHVDQTAVCKQVTNQNGSWLFTFEYDKAQNNVTVEKGSVCVNGVSLTVVNSELNKFSVAIIPYTFKHTTFKNIKAGSTVNLEFDIIGKYVSKYLNVFGK